MKYVRFANLPFRYFSLICGSCGSLSKTIGFVNRWFFFFWGVIKPAGLCRGGWVVRMGVWGIDYNIQYGNIALFGVYVVTKRKYF